MKNLNKQSKFISLRRSFATKKRNWLYWFRLLGVGLIGGGTLGYFSFVALFIEAAKQPRPSTICCTTPGDLGHDYLDVVFTSQDGVTLSGWYIPSQNRAAVILLHGDGGNRLSMLKQADILARHGYGALLYDLRAHGQSGGSMRTMGWLDTQDVTAAVAFLQNREDVDPGRLGIMGFSLGGQIALRAIAQSDQLQAVVADGPGLANVRDVPPAANLMERVNIFMGGIVERLFSLRTGVAIPEAVVSQIGSISPRPILLIAAGDEEYFVENYYNYAHQPKTYWQIPETSHGGGLAARPKAYEEAIIRLFDDGLLTYESISGKNTPFAR